jgi:hypothetical protein
VLAIETLAMRQKLATTILPTTTKEFNMVHRLENLHTQKQRIKADSGLGINKDVQLQDDQTNKLQSSALPELPQA